jgi:tetratricopeptide (TPR) repeat protein
MQSARNPSRSAAIIILRKEGRRNWIFELPRITPEVDDRLDEGIDWLHTDPKHAAFIFAQLVREFPEHMDAYHHLGLALQNLGRKQEAFQIWQDGLDLALRFFPPRFSMQRDRLDWGFIENRPFLRLYYGLGYQYLKRAEFDRALEIFNNLLNLNPNDNQGIRGHAVECHFALDQPEGVLEVCRRYPYDALEDLMYGKVLAFLQLGKLRPAIKALRRAVEAYPLIAEELTKSRHRKPKGANEERITLRSPEQAYLYWKSSGRYWTSTPGAIDFVKVQARVL